MSAEPRPLTADHVTRFAALSPPNRWLAWAFSVGIGAAIAASTLADNTVCSPASPCEPSRAFAVVVALAWMGFILLWWPRLEWALAIIAALGVLDAIYDPAGWGRLAFAMVGVAAGFALWWVRTIREKQRELFRNNPIHREQIDLAALAELAYRPTRNLLLGLAALVTAIGSGGWFVHLDNTARAHRATSVQVQALVTQVNISDVTVDVEFTDPTGAERQRTFNVLETNDYVVGATAPVRVDRLDPGWSELVAEPQDDTFWLSAFVAAAIAGLVLLLEERQALRQSRRLIGEGDRALAVSVLVDEDSWSLVLPAAGTGPAFARLDSSLLSDADHRTKRDPGDAEPAGHGRDDDVDDEVDPEVFGRWFRGEIPSEDDDEDDGLAPEQAILIGDICIGGWCAIRIKDGWLVPNAPLSPVVRAKDPRPDAARASVGPAGLWQRTLQRWWPNAPAAIKALGRGRPSGEELDAAMYGFFEDGELPGSAVSADSAMPLTLPTRLSRVGWRRWLGALGMVIVAIGMPWLTRDLDNWGDRLLALFASINIVWLSLEQWAPTVTMDEQQLVIRAPGAIHHVPWAALHGVRQQGDYLLLSWEPDVVILVGAFGGEGLFAMLEQQQTTRVGATMMRCRDAANLAAPTSSSHPESAARASRRPGPAWLVYPALIAAWALAVWS